jgi:hypothetical protein
MDRGFRIIAVEQTRDTANATKFVRENGLNYRFVENWNGKEEFAKALFGYESTPTSYLIDRKGRIVCVHVGFNDGDETEYEKQIVELLDAQSSG